MDGWCSLEPSGAFGVGLWRFVRRGRGNFSCHTRFEVENGSKIRFWHDQWCGDMALKEVFPVLFGIAYKKDASVADHLESIGASNQWDVSFTREAHDWEVDVLASFLRVLYSTRMSRESEDKLWWVAPQKRLFKVRSFYSSLIFSEGSCFPSKNVWRTKAPLRTAFFCVVSGSR